MEDNSNIVGIDISDAAIKILQIDNDRNVISYASNPLPRGIVFAGKILKQREFRDILVRSLKDVGIKFTEKEEAPKINIIVNLPEEKLFTYYMDLPRTIANEAIDTYVRKEAAKVIPYKLENMCSDYLLVEGKDSKDALFISVQREYIDNYVATLTFGNIELMVIGSELFALGRSLLNRSTFINAAVVDIGDRTTNIGIFDTDYVMHLSVTKRTGGADITKAIMNGLGVPLDKAEEMKRTYGVLKKHDSKDSPQIIRNTLRGVVDEIEKAISYFQEKAGATVGTIILTGGSSLIPGITDLIHEKTKNLP